MIEQSDYDYVEPTLRRKMFTKKERSKKYRRGNCNKNCDWCNVGRRYKYTANDKYTKESIKEFYENNIHNR